MEPPAAADVNDPSRGRSSREMTILRAAYRVMARDGGHRLNLQAIADEAESSKGLILYHFGSKANLLQAAMRWALLETARRIEDAMGGQADLDDARDDSLTPLLEAIFVSPQANRDFQLVYIDLVEHAVREPAFAELPAMTRSIIEPLYAEVIRTGIERGEFHVEDADRAALAMRAVIDGIFLQWLQRLDWETSHGEFQQLCHDALTALLR